ncbi:hypothetical protein N1030_16045 [Desulfovibrio mangrovi]|uniref:hypothetical protein n=1 Tax=Desulfovibrio mangrovi TaxID=2976983 RepID=UPI0022469736|nr:hypothetical protein [Desulfovibrio mangrovi]UZP67097.1 hypothetical protein N1030_16045 [Desulfovibrio mangrovi]
MAYFRAIIGFSLAISIVFAIEMALLYGIGIIAGKTLTPRGAGWILLPIMAGIAGGRFLYQQPVFHSTPLIFIVSLLDRQPQIVRFYLAGLLVWLLSLLAYVFIFEGFGNYVSRSEILLLIKLSTIPPIIALVGIYAIQKAKK